MDQQPYILVSYGVTALLLLGLCISTLLRARRISARLKERDDA